MRITFSFFLFLFLFNLTLQSQIITTVAGNGSHGYSGDGGPALDAQLSDMYYSYPAFDNAGNMYIAHVGNNTIRKIDAAGIITTIAGTPGVIGYSGDGGPAINALLYHPTAIAVDKDNNILISDRNGLIIRMIDPAGIITTVSANEYSMDCGVGDGGPLALAKFYAISAITTDQSGNLYIADYGCNTVRKVNSAGIISTIAGNGTNGFSGDGGPATSAQLAYPGKVAIDQAGNVYIPDAQNHKIRKVSTTGIITTIAGTVQGYSGDGGPATDAKMAFPGSVVIDQQGNFYIGDYNHTIRKIDLNGNISTYAGKGTNGYSGDGGPASASSISLTEGRISIHDNNIYFVNHNEGNVIRKITNCLAVTIKSQPVEVKLCIAGNAQFEVTADHATNYQWQFNSGTGWIDIVDNAGYSGTLTNKLSINGANATMNNHQFRCAVTNDCGTIYSTAAVLSVKAPFTPGITIQASKTNICQGETVTFSSSGVHGNASTYQWMKNGIPVGTNIHYYIDQMLIDGDIIQCIVTSGESCLTNPVAVSNSITMSVTPNVTPGVFITASNNNICEGTPVTFSSALSFGGTSPSFTWFKNNENLFLNSPTYTDASLKNGDVIFLGMFSSQPCVTRSLAISPQVVMNIYPKNEPGITISPSSTSICKNTPIIFTASTLHEGFNPTYQWKKNGRITGTNHHTYIDNSLVDGDRITCTLTSDDNCISISEVTSNTVSVIINPEPIVRLDQSATICENEIRTLDAGNFSTYLWNDGSTGKSIRIADPGIYSVSVTDNNGCIGTGSVEISTVLPAPKNFLSADTSICTYGNLELKANKEFRSYFWNTGSNNNSITINQPGQY